MGSEMCIRDRITQFAADPQVLVAIVCAIVGVVLVAIAIVWAIMGTVKKK